MNPGGGRCGCVTREELGGRSGLEKAAASMSADKCECERAPEVDEASEAAAVAAPPPCISGDPPS
jgi:hypothetical protein